MKRVCCRAGGRVCGRGGFRWAVLMVSSVCLHLLVAQCRCLWRDYECHLHRDVSWEHE
jgi:hypothetical protein